MKVQIILACTLALTFAWAPEPVKYKGPQHVPIIHKGVPIEPLAVQHARAQHFAALAKVKSHPEYQNIAEYKENYNNDDYYNDVGEYTNDYKTNYQQQFNYPQYHQQEVGHIQIPQHVYQHHSHAHVQVGHDGYLIDTPEVQAAKSKHLAALHKAASHGGEHYRKRRSADSYLRYTTPYISFGINKLRDTNDIILVQAGDYNSKENSYSINQIHAPVYGHQYSHDIQNFNQIHTPIYSQHSQGIAVIDHAGYPVDTPEVQHAKALHFAAHKEALLRNALGYHAVDTPEVQQAKLQHFAAHEAIKGHHY